MGFVFSTDFLLWRRPGIIDAAAGIPAFITARAGKRWKQPARLYGRLRRGPGEALLFVWRPWLIGARREMDLGQPKNFQCGSTLLYPVVLEGAVEKPLLLFRLPPRYRRNEKAIADALELCGWRDVSIFRGIWSTMKQYFQDRRLPAFTEK
jgi:hypothetical protein